MTINGRVQHNKARRDAAYVNGRNARRVDQEVGAKFKKIRGDSSLAKRQAAIGEKGLEEGDSVAFPSQPAVSYKILRITEAAELKLVGFSETVSPCAILKVS